MVKSLSSNNNNTIKFLCSYGGKIVPRHTDGLLRYSGGLTRFLAVDRSISFSELMLKLEEFCGSSVVLRCQLPDGDLETLVAVRSDEDLASIVEEYDRSDPIRSPSIRAVLSPSAAIKKVSSSSSIESDHCSPRPRRFSHTACSSPQKRADSGFYGGGSRCYSPPAGYPANLRYYPAGGKPRYSYRVAHWQ